MFKKIQNYTTKKQAQFVNLLLRKKYLVILIPLIITIMLVTLVGFIDATNKINQVEVVNNQKYLYPVLRFGQYGLMNGLGKITVMPIYKNIEVIPYKADIPIPVQFLSDSSNRYGYVRDIEGVDEETDKEVVIRPKYVLAGAFKDGIAKVFSTRQDLDSNKSSFINQDGETVLTIDEYGEYSNGMVSVKNIDNTYNYINLKGEVILKNLVFDPSYEIGYYNDYLSLNKTLYNKFSKTVFTSNYDTLGVVSEGLIAVTRDNKLGFVNLQGETVITPQYDLGIYDVYKDIDFRDNPNINLRVDKEQDRVEDFVFVDGLARVRKDKKYHFINKENKIVIEDVGVEVKNIAKQRSYNSFNDGLAIKVVDKEGKKSCGYIDKTGKEIISPKFKNCNIFVGKLVLNDGNYIDRIGEVVNSYNYD